METTALERRAIKRQKLVTKSKSDAGLVQGSLFEPAINPLNYKMDLVKALNYYNSAYSDSDKRAWVEEYVGPANRHNLNKLIDYDFRSVGAIIRLADRGEYLEDNEISFIDAKLSELYSLNTKKNQEVVEPTAYKVVNAATKKEKLEDSAAACAGAFDGMLDDFRHSGTTPDFDGYLQRENVSASVAALIPKNYSWIISEIKETFKGTDEQLTESYAYMSRIKLRKYLTHLESIAVVCDKHAQAVKVDKPVVRKVRTIKAKPVSQIVKGMKYLAEDANLGIKSISTTKLVGAKEAWVFNTKTRKLLIYRAVEGDVLGVRCASIIGFDDGLSVSKTIRKPEYVKTLVAMPKREFNIAYNAIKAVEGIPGGHISKDCLLLKVS